MKINKSNITVIVQHVDQFQEDKSVGKAEKCHGRRKSHSAACQKSAATDHEIFHEEKKNIVSQCFFMGKSNISMKRVGDESHSMSKTFVKNVTVQYVKKCIEIISDRHVVEKGQKHNIVYIIVFQ